MHTNEHIYKTETNSWTQRTDLWFPKRVGCRGEKEWEFEISRGKLLHIEWINTRSDCIAQGTIFNIRDKS